MEAFLLERTEVGDDALRALGARRAEHVKGYLVGKGQLPADRVLVAAAPAETPADGKSRMSVDFTLR
jgi:outer membrane protein OmpA-like peptidoglycan-associated protein